jgi:hypothetical protein
MQPRTPVMKSVRKPRFVDNAVRHGEYTRKQAGFTVEKPTATDFVPTAERQVSPHRRGGHHSFCFTIPTESVRYEGALFYDVDKVTTSTQLPALVVGSEDHRQALVLSQTQDATKGTRYRLENLKGRSLSEIGFTDKTIRFAQKVGVGDAGLPTSPVAWPRSTRVASMACAPSSTVARSWHRISTASKPSPLCGIFPSMTATVHAETASATYATILSPTSSASSWSLRTGVTGGSMDDDSDSAPNRVVVRGKPRANNHANVVQVDDFGRQEKGVVEVPGGIPRTYRPHSHQCTRHRQANASHGKERPLARRSWSTSSGAGHMHPGDMVSYQTRVDNERYVVPW